MVARRPTMSVDRIRDRVTFDALRRSSHRASSGVVRIVHVPVAELPTRTVSRPGERRAGYAIGKKVGTAVERNRVRRRIRCLLAEAEPTTMPSGAYLITVRPGAADLSYEELRTDVERALTRLASRRHADATRVPASADAPSVGS